MAQDWEPLRKSGFDNEALLEVAHVVGIFNYLTRLADGFGLQLDSAVEEAARTGVALKRQPSSLARRVASPSRPERNSAKRL